jgi:hypothetical protein
LICGSFYLIRDIINLIWQVLYFYKFYHTNLLF